MTIPVSVGLYALAGITGLSEERLHNLVTCGMGTGPEPAKPFLRERERIVLQMRYRLSPYSGGWDTKPARLESIGDVLGLPRERIRQIEAKALRKLSELRAGEYDAPTEQPCPE